MKNKVFVIGLSGESVFLNVDEYHKNGETLHSKTFKSEVGGKGYNQVIALNKFGSDVFYLSSIGYDYYGEKCEEFLKQKNVNSLFVKKDLPTAFATILTNSHGENQVTVYDGATRLLDKRDVLKVEDEIKTSSVVLLQLEVPLSVNLEAVRIAKANNVKVIINPAPAINYNLELLQYADIITPNESEARKIFGMNESEDINNILVKMKEVLIKEVIVTLGDKGAMRFFNESVEYYPPLKVKAVDTTGAGDIFNAMLAYMISNETEMKLAIEYAIIASALSVTRKGVVDAIFKLEEVKEEYEKNRH